MSFWKKALAASAITLTCLTAAFGTKLSYAYFANAVTGNNSSAHGTLNTGAWRDYHTEGTAISTVAQFKAILTTSTSGTYYLANSINFNNTAITSSNATFKGILYGNGFTLSNLPMSSACRGIFGNLSGATIDNLILDNIDIGTSSSRASNPAGVLVGSITGDNTTLSRIRIYNSTVYNNNSSGAGGLVGYTNHTLTVSDVSIQSTIIDNNNNSAGGILGSMTSATVTMNDIYVQATIGATNYVGGVVGSIANNSGSNLVLNRAVVYATLTADTSYAGGIVGDNLSTKAQSLTNFIFTGVENSGSNRAGTIGNGTAMTYTNGWAAQWSSSTIAAYANMTGQSVPAATKYLAARSSLTTAWWSTNLNSIASNGKWMYSATNYLYYLKP